MEIILTKHAQLRLAERCGLNKKSMNRMTQRAYTSGIGMEDVKGSVKAWMAERYNRNNEIDYIKLYGDKAWFFSKNRLVTVIQIPHEIIGKTRVFTKSAGEKQDRSSAPRFI